MNQLFLETPALTKQIMRSFYCERQIEAVLARLAKGSVWIGPGENEFKLNYDEIAAYFAAGKDQVPICSIEDDQYEIIYAGEESCVVTGNLKIHTVAETEVLVEFLQRVTFVYIVEDDAICVKHMHISTPYSEMLQTEFFPMAVGTRNYEYLQRILTENIKAMDLLTITMKTGMKGSFDDDLYSFFYVNEGLAKMLGYTHQEFMLKSENNAAGAVYLPDRQHFLDKCREGLLIGNEYSVEYRMEKQDGSLIWVMDTGRKVHNSDGTMLINSVVTDITELKQTVFELETERERYRIALENVSDVMFEYDILQDTFISFEKVNSETGTRMERFEIADFSATVQSGEVIYPDDIEKLMKVYRGQLREKIDVRIKDPKDLATDFWSWKSVYCSVVYDADHQAVRTIGALRDITQEKEREAKLVHQAQRDSLTGLLNQNAVKVYMKQYLLTKQSDETYALLIIDLDYFKQVNDTFGHLAGNAALMGVSEKLTNTCRATDLVGRIGGDEFMVVLKSVTLAQAMHKGTEILKEVRSVFVGDGTRFGLSCSIGIAFSTRSKQNYEILFDHADKALYWAKKKGRNCYAISGEN